MEDLLDRPARFAFFVAVGFIAILVFTFGFVYGASWLQFQAKWQDLPPACQKVITFWNQDSITCIVDANGNTLVTRRGNG